MTIALVEMGYVVMIFVSVVLEGRVRRAYGPADVLRFISSQEFEACFLTASSEGMGPRDLAYLQMYHSLVACGLGRSE